MRSYFTPNNLKCHTIGIQVIAHIDPAMIETLKVTEWNSHDKWVKDNLVKWMLSDQLGWWID